MSDIRNTSKGRYALDALKMWHLSNKRQGRVAVAVESAKDENFYRRFFEPVRFFVLDGWEGVVALMELAEKDVIKGVLGIIDADFRHVMNESAPINVFLTDHHDLELMQLHSPAFETILSQHAEYGIPGEEEMGRLDAFEKKNNEPFLQSLLKSARPLGVLRFLNHRDTLNLTFKIQKKQGGEFSHLNHDDFIDPLTLKCDRKAMFKAVENKSSRLGFFGNHPNVVQNFEKEMLIDHDVWEICNGHDVLNILGLALREAIGRNKSKPHNYAQSLEELLTVAYHFEDFKKTQLYKNLLAWETSLAPNFKLFKSQVA